MMKPLLKNPWISLPSLALVAMLLFVGAKNFAPPRVGGFLQELLEQLQAFQQLRPEDRVYAQTDKPFYKPGETIWFSAYLRNGTDFTPSETSDILKVELLNPKGGIEKQYQLIAQDGVAKGDFLLPETAPGGLYKLRVYSEWQQNDPRPAIFEKELTVQKVVLPRLKMKLDFEREAYGPGATVEAELDLQTNANQALSQHPFQFTVSLAGQALLSESRQTGTDGKAMLQFDLPKDLDSNDGLLNVLIEYQGQTEAISRSVPIVLNQVALQFFPEGGDLVHSLPGRVAFRALNEFGKPADVAGIIVDEKGEKVADFLSYHQGMGAFDLVPLKWKKYTARITQPAGVTQTFELPDLLPRGYGLAVRDISEDLITLHLHSSETETLSLIGTVRDQSFYAADIDISPEGKEIRIPTREFPIGVVRFTLFDSKGIERCERLAFVNQHQQLQVEIETDKEKYLPREEVKLSLRVTDERGMPMPAQLSLAVTDDQLLSFADDKSSNLLSWLLLESDLRGEVEEPNFYFDPEEEKASLALDYLLMTAGWRRFDWREMTQRNQPALTHSAQQAIIGGQVVNERAEPLVGISVRVGNQRVETDRNGFFEVRDLPLYAPTSLQIAHSGYFPYQQAITSYQQGMQIRLAKQPAYAVGNPKQGGQMIYGTITDEVGEPLIGAIVVVPGTARGASTNLDGNYSVEIFPGERVQVRYLGYQAIEFQVSRGGVYNHQIQEDRAVLSEVVVGGSRNDIRRSRKNKIATNSVQQIPVRNQPAIVKADQVQGVQQKEEKRKRAESEKARPVPAQVPTAAVRAEAVAPQLMNDAMPIELADEIAPEPALMAEDKEMKEDEEADFFGKNIIFAEEIERAPQVDAFIFAEEEPRPINLSEVRQRISYPAIARDAAIEGTVVVRVLVGKKGNYQQHEIIRPVHPILAKSVEEQIHSMKFTPAIQGGKPVPFWVNIPIRFDLMDNQGPAVNSQAAPANSQGSTVYYRAREFATPEYRNQPRPETRTDFRSTIYWNGLVEVDRTGRAELSFFTSDALTSFQVIAEGIGQDGSLGRGTHQLFTQLPFAMSTKLPTSLISGDTVRIPLTLANNTGEALSGRISYHLPPGLLPLRALPTEVQMPAEEAHTIFLPFKVTASQGQDSLRIGFRCGSFSDAVQQQLHISSRGFPAAYSYSGEEKSGSFSVDLSQAVEGSMDIQFTAFPDVSSEILSGLEGMLQEPHGCFEQTSSTTYPNLLVLGYLEETGQAAPGIQQRALGLIQRGYQRLISYESQGGGYEWFGKSPAHEGLTAYGLMEFIDMQRVYAGVDQQMIDRTSKWLMSRRDGKGGFQRNSHALHQFGLSDQETMSLYITWALSEAGYAGLEKEVEFAYQTALRTRQPYQLGLAANTLYNYGDPARAGILIRELVQSQGEEGEWMHTVSLRSAPGSGGQALSIETASLALLAMLKSPEKDRPRIDRVATYIRSLRSGSGRFGSTNSTVLALRALIAHARYAKQTQSGGTIELLVDGKIMMEKSYEAGQKEPIIIRGMEQGLSRAAHTFEIRFEGTKQALPHTFAVNWHSKLPQSEPACAVGLQTSLQTGAAAQGETVRLTAELRNRTSEGLPMTMAILGIPAGLSAQPWQLKELQEKGTVAFYEVWDNEVICYFRGMAPGEVKTIHLDLKADIPGAYSAPASRAYLYYTDEEKDWAQPLAVLVGE